MYKILVVDDDFEILKLMRTILEMKNYQVTTYQEVTVPININNFKGFDLILLDVMMPNIDGITVMEEIRKTSVIPIIFITAMSTDSDKVLALGLGADDYIVKPINTIELTARVASQLRRCYQYVNNKEEYTKIVLGELTLNKENYEVYKNNIKIDLNPKEFKILDLLMSNSGRVYTKKQIYEKVWEESYFAIG